MPSYACSYALPLHPSTSAHSSPLKTTQTHTYATSSSSPLSSPLFYTGSPRSSLSLPSWSYPEDEIRGTSRDHLGRQTRLRRVGRERVGEEASWASLRGWDNKEKRRHTVQETDVDTTLVPGRGERENVEKRVLDKQDLIKMRMLMGDLEGLGELLVQTALKRRGDEEWGGIAEEVLRVLGAVEEVKKGLKEVLGSGELGREGI